MTVRSSLVSALLLSAAFALPASAAGPVGSQSGTTAAGAPAAPAATPIPTTAETPTTTETPPTDLSASGTATPATPTTAATSATTDTTATEPPATAGASAPAATTDETMTGGRATASATTASGAVTAQAGAPVMGAHGEKLGTVASTDAQGNVQLTTSSGKTVTLASGLVADSGGTLTASSVSQKDVMAMAATQQGDQQAAAQASTRTALHARHRRHLASNRAHHVPASATGDEAAGANDQAPAEQPAQSQTPQQ
jgi:pilus assembly protein FimV